VLKRIMPTAPRTLSLQEAADQLGLHYMTVYRYVRTGKLPAAQDGMVWRVRAGDVNALEKRGKTKRRSPFRPDISPDTRRAFEARLLAGDSSGAWWLVEGRLGGGLDPADVLTTLVSPALRSIGERWADGDLNVADEHRATAMAQRIIGRLGLQFGRPGRSRGTVVLAAPAGDLHALPVAIVADLLRWRGFDVSELGANTPPDALANAVSQAHRLVAVGIASTTTGQDAQVARSVEAVRATEPTTAILLGGGAIRDSLHVRALGAEIWTGHDGLNVVESIETLSDSGRIGAAGHA
jgi:excisionase family DNA binding protein